MLRIWLSVVVVSLLAACSTAPQQSSTRTGAAPRITTPRAFAPPRGFPNFVDHSIGREEIPIQAMSLVGIPYRWGGNTPDSGFDCSGLVRYIVSRAANVSLPRTTAEMSTRGESIEPDEIAPGDLVFFNTTGRPHSHVGIYVGKLRFVNAPSTGGTVRLDYLTNPYWAKHFDGIRRVAPARHAPAPFDTPTYEADNRQPDTAPVPQAAPAAAAPKKAAALPDVKVPASATTWLNDRPEQRVPMSRLRARIAERLLESQQTNAILTTFNEVNMQPVMDLRAKYKDKFEKEHGVKLGFMSFFVKAAVHALKKFPLVNASIDGNDIVYHGYFDIGIAVGSPRGLVVPILRNADQLSLADIEKKIAEFGQKAKDGKLSIEEMTGGTFSISNGGVFGSMLSTPIINPPQSAILGVHATKERPVVENGQIVIRPINYLALSYDHRIIDGREAVLSLVAMKDALEDPARLLLDL
ncbi:2-oxoglutarate dehydrogenase complex dihydrolipoyllysine-residue succinyltransferase [Burkholderia sp. Cy-647]|nr:2-oxoglutarate dehydrogenase complex dihydrolipoyllysine-residue succinyltransferase [Burkholderia sp. Cy-647]